jgi:hypothetical protein
MEMSQDKRTDATLKEFERIVGNGAVAAMFARSTLQLFRQDLAAAIVEYHQVKDNAANGALRMAAGDLAQRIEDIRQFMGEDNYRAMMEELRLRETPPFTGKKGSGGVV